MHIACPSCASEYEIDPAKLGEGGRTVRCAICRDTWFAAAPGAAEEPLPEETPAGATLLAAPKPKPARPRVRTPLLVAASLVLALAGATQIPSAWIEIGRAKAVQLVRPSGADLLFRNVRSEIDGPAAERVLKVSGEIVNRSARATDVPHLEFLLRSGDERVLATWTSAPPQAHLNPQEVARFEARFVGPPLGGKDVKVRFTQADSIAVAAHDPK